MKKALLCLCLLVAIVFVCDRSYAAALFPRLMQEQQHQEWMSVIVFPPMEAEPFGRIGTTVKVEDGPSALTFDFLPGTCTITGPLIRSHDDTAFFRYNGMELAATLQVDQNRVRDITLECERDGAQTTLAVQDTGDHEALIRELKGGRTAVFRIATPEGTILRRAYSLIGFTQAYTRAFRLCRQITDKEMRILLKE